MRVLVALVPLLGAACLDTFEPDVGPLVNAPCIDADSDPEVDVSFREDIVAGIAQRPDIDCVRCHTPNGATPIGLDDTGFDMSSYSTLRRGGINSGETIVVAGQPCSSVLYQKVGPAPPFGTRMPVAGPPFLSELDLQRLHDWIAEGALDN